MCREVKGCQGILVRTAQVTRKVMEAEPALKIAARHGTGMDIIDIDAATELGIQVTNTPESNGASVAELTIGGMISVCRKIYLLSNSAKKGDFFFKNHCSGFELAGKTLGLIGFGDIGRRVAQIAAFGFQIKMSITGICRTSKFLTSKACRVGRTVSNGRFYITSCPYAPGK